MRSEVYSELFNNWFLQLQRDCWINSLLIEEVPQITESETNTLGNCLGCIPRIEHTKLGHFGQQVNDGMRKILNLVDHHIVDLRTSISFESYMIENVVYCIHKIICSDPELPSLVLTEDLVYLEFLILWKERISWLLDIGLLCHVLTSIEMRSSTSSDRWVNFSPN